MWNSINKKVNFRGGRQDTDYLCIPGGKVSVVAEHRVLKISPNLVPKETTFPKNRIISNKLFYLLQYTLWNFVPKNLFEQFRRIANFYFLLTALVAIIIDSPISPLTSSVPLVFVILVTACKQGYEDFNRYRSDQRVNRTLCTVIRNKCVQNIHCEKIVVGDLVKVSRDEDVPSDLLLLYSSDESNSCYVTTSNLDGETNLKTLYVPRVVSSISITDIVSMEAVVTCQHPIPNLYTFHGKIEVTHNNEQLNGFLTIDNVLLRGARLKDTEFVIGCAIYTGQDTKLSMNSKITTNKFSTVERSINTYLLVFIIVLLVEIFFSTLMKAIIEIKSNRDDYWSQKNPITARTVLVDIFSFTLLYNYIVPISLYVTAEMQKFLGSFFFGWDIDLYDEATDQPAKANTSDLNEELGQVEYLFTDKTGTLTDNLMVFRRCSINGKCYMEKDCDGNLYLLPSSGIEELAEKLETWQPDIWHFMISISLCHAVHIAPPSQKASIMARRSFFRESFRQKKTTVINSSLLMDPDLPEYQAASADEKALVEASARCGVVFQKDSGDELELKVKDDILKFKRLETLEFTSERKRMSVVVEDAAGDLWLYCKGADSAIFPLIVKGRIKEANDHISDFSVRGLRTLVIGYKKLKQTDYARLMQNIEYSRQIIGDQRAEQVERAYRAMEDGLTLLGVTAVEDRLQDDVPETLESLRAAGIKIWILTGDKAETAENIAFLCGHFKKGTELLRLMDQVTAQSCCITLTSFERRVMLDPYKQYGIIMDGVSMATAYKNCPELLRSVAMSCEAVVCCRMSPLQKSEMVQLLKCNGKKPITAAIGDGGNDVSMIQEAHVGIGIMGKEGRQAAMNSDFAFTKFRFLRKALLVHGHWYYVRLSILTQYFFYKNLVFITPQFLFGFSSKFSTQSLFDSIFLMCYNTIFTCVPVLLYGLFEQDYSADKLLKYPQLYKINSKNYLLSTKQFAIWSFIAVWHTCASYFIPFSFWYINPINLYDNTEAGHWVYSTCIFHIVTLVTGLKILLYSTYWTTPFVVSVVLSEISFYIVASTYSGLNIRYDGDMLWVFYKLLMSPTFWLLTVVTTVTCFIPDFLILIYKNYRPMRVAKQHSRKNGGINVSSSLSQSHAE
ncbi:probable phospholipid-transporting ATPase IF isoform X3 [Cephus cinctus]|uniref:Phospholipid-transporting ATPase n=1 Tax=Cephus cinctus TaxID=211228 RepID=A0AAJ7RAN5_CEPCN|nr:probable phospholipid-transporting ATPase IF isoform X3 [Cephus cinctus]